MKRIMLLTLTAALILMQSSNLSKQVPNGVHCGTGYESKTASMLLLSPENSQFQLYAADDPGITGPRKVMLTTV